MTLADIKAQLPTVKINLGDRVVVRAGIAGRKNDYATVYLPAAGIHYHKAYKHQSWQFSWQAIERAINSDTALEI